MTSANLLPPIESQNRSRVNTTGETGGAGWLESQVRVWGPLSHFCERRLTSQSWADSYSCSVFETTLAMSYLKNRVPQPQRLTLCGVSSETELFNGPRNSLRLILLQPHFTSWKPKTKEGATTMAKGWQLRWLSVRPPCELCSP